MINTISPTLSIIVPIYKVELYLKECLESILKQPYTDFELILVDDGSPDKCGEICDSYAIKDSRVIVIHKENGGLSSARNAGIDIAKGDYLSFIDSDDFISDDYYLENMSYLISHPLIDMVVMQVCHFDNIINKILFNDYRELINKCEIVNYMLSMDYIGASWINIYKKDIFKKLRFPEGRIFEDGYILTEIVERVSKVFLSNVGIYYYRKRENSIMQKKKTLKDWIDILSVHTKQLDYCYTISDDKKLFIGKYKVCHLALIYASLKFPNYNFQEFQMKFQSYDYNLVQLSKGLNSIKSITKLYLLKYIGFTKMIKLYKVFGVYKNI